MYSYPGALRRTPDHATRYRFVESYLDMKGRKILVWQRPMSAGDSRVEQIECAADYFWSKP